MSQFTLTFCRANGLSTKQRSSNLAKKLYTAYRDTGKMSECRQVESKRMKKDIPCRI